MGPCVTTFKIRRSRVPWGRSDFGGILCTSTYTLWMCRSQRGMANVTEKFRGNGAGDGIRTRDIDLGKVALYQLSYSRARQAAPIFAPRSGKVKLSLGP